MSQNRSQAAYAWHGHNVHPPKACNVVQRYICHEASLAPSLWRLERRKRPDTVNHEVRVDHRKDLMMHQILCLLQAGHEVQHEWRE